MSLAQVIKNEARRLGFTLVGITTPDPPPHLSTYDNWLTLGRNGSMGYLAKERSIQRRRNPKLVLPECRSILVLAIRYPDPSVEISRQSKEPGRTGQIAAYAWGQDYHLVLIERLKSLAKFAEDQVVRPLSYRYYTDTGPLLEREMAQRAGLGWIGKNTCLINPNLGSYFLLTEILLSIELEPDLPFTADRCGRCKRCIEACPTGCILPDRTLDARRCISYLTIENKENITENLRPLIGRWVFGCDVCQVVCPWNRFSASEYDQAFAPCSGIREPDLKTELALTSQEFNRKFKHSPVQRARWKGYLRNVAVALGNSGDLQAIPALEKASQADDLLVREHAVWAINEIRKKTD